MEGNSRREYGRIEALFYHKSLICYKAWFILSANAVAQRIFTPHGYFCYKWGAGIGWALVSTSRLLRITCCVNNCIGFAFAFAGSMKRAEPLPQISWGRKKWPPQNQKPQQASVELSNCSSNTFAISRIQIHLWEVIICSLLHTGFYPDTQTILNMVLQWQFHWMLSPRTWVRMVLDRAVGWAWTSSLTCRHVSALEIEKSVISEWLIQRSLFYFEMDGHNCLACATNNSVLIKINTALISLKEFLDCFFKLCRILFKSPWNWIKILEYICAQFHGWIYCWILCCGP